MVRMLRLSFVAVTILTAGCGTLVHARRDITLREPWAAYERVEVHVRNGSIELTSGGVDEISIAATLRVGGFTLVEAERNLDKLEVTAAADPAHPATFRIELNYPSELNAKSPGASLRIAVPEPCAALLDTSNGSIRVENLKGDVVLDTSNGVIRAKHVDGTLRATSSNGRVEVEHVTGELRVKSSNGSLDAREIGGPCELVTSNGRIGFVAAAGAAAPIELRSSNGAIEATIPKGLAADLDLSTSNGSVKVVLGDVPLRNIEYGRTWFRGAMNGGGTPVRARTSNGSITVNAR